MYDDEHALHHVLTDPPVIQHDKAYIIIYDEDLWLKYNEITRDYCKQVWRSKAKSNGCTNVALRLVPDPLFPSSDKLLPYFGWQENLVTGSTAEKPMYRYECTVTVERSELLGPLVRRERNEIIAQLARRYPTGTKWHITYGGEELETGIL